MIKKFNMKLTPLILIAYFSLSFLCDATSQDSIIIGIKAHIQSDKVLLRWAPLNENSFNWCNKYGYNLKRYTIKNNGQSLSYQDMIASEVYLLDSIGPISDSIWESIDSSDFSQIAAGSLYGERFNTFDLDTAKLSEKNTAALERQNRYSFGLYAADQSYSVAKMMALAFTDSTIQSGKEYFYEIEPAKKNNSDYYEKTSIVISPTNVTTFDPPQDIDQMVVNKEVTLFWPTNVPGNNYTGYFIERSSDNMNFTRLNEIPHMSLTNEINPFNVIYQTTLPDTVNEYYYRTIGYSPFGFEGPPSNSIKVKASREKKYTINNIEEVKEQSDGSMKIKWKHEQGNVSDIAGYKILKAVNPDSPFVQLNNSLLPASQLEFTDPSPSQYNFYRIVAVDVNGFEHPTVMQVGQQTDTTAPAVPSGFSGIGFKTGYIDLKWNRNTEPDLIGYRIFFSNFPDDEYAEISNDIITDTTFSYEVDLDNLSKNLYFKIMALDQKYNESAYSPWILVKRPDIIPPSAANLFIVDPIFKGARLRFIMSPSNDVEFHRIQRKEFGKNFWSMLKQYDGIRTDVNEIEFLDTTASYKKSYTYRVAVYDDGGLITYSKTFKITPLPPPVRGNVYDISHIITTPPGLVINGQYYATTNQFHYKDILLLWNYSDIEDVEEFVIYRKVGNGPMITLRTISYDYWQRLANYPGVTSGKFFFIDDELLTKRSYLNSLSNNGGSGGNGGSNGGGSNGGGSNGGGSGNGGAASSNYGNDTYIYQIKCKHKDGSMSNPSQLYTINL